MDERTPTAFEGAWPPEMPEQPPFSATRRECFGALLMYVLAYVYTNLLFGAGTVSCEVWLSIFTLGFAGLTEFLHWGEARTRESWVWLACTAVILAGTVTGRCRVWDYGQSVLFLHIFAVYWAVSRSGRLLEGESSHLLPLDGLFAFVAFPFGNFFLRIRCIFFGLRSLRPEKRRLRGDVIFAIIAASLLTLGLLGRTVQLLSDADTGFAELSARFTDLFRFRWDGDLFARFLLSLPVGAYLFGLLAGSRRLKPETRQSRAGAIQRGLEKLRRIPNVFWCAVGGVFTAVYLAFFFLQGSYLFGAFTRTLPEGFIVSEYARQGFFELCKVSGINFFLLWLITRTSEAPVRQRPAALWICALLLVQNALFAVIALSKLGLYISCFGFTPLRLQSTWLACVLLAGCGCSLYTLLTGRKSLRGWMMFGALSLALLHLY